MKLWVTVIVIAVYRHLGSVEKFTPHTRGTELSLAQCCAVGTNER